MFVAKPREHEQYLFNLEGIECYLSAASYAAAISDSNLVKKILMELSTKRVLIESTVYYDDFQFDVSKDGYYWEIFKDYIGTFENFDGVNFVMFLKDWDMHTKRPIYKNPLHKPVIPVKENGESELYFAFRKKKYNIDRINWEKLKKSPMPLLPKLSLADSATEKILIQKEYEEQLCAWKEARLDLENDKKQARIKEQRKKEKELLELEHKIKDKKLFSFQREQFMDEYRIRQVNVNLIDVYSYGRMKDAFGKYGYCMTNPICITHFAQNGIDNYLRRVMFDCKKVIRHDTITIYKVSNIEGTTVQEVVVEFEGLNDKKVLFFAENCKITRLDLPDKIYEYHKTIDTGNIKFSLRLPPKDYNKMALVRYEESVKKPFTYEIVWKK